MLQVWVSLYLKSLAVPLRLNPAPLDTPPWLIWGYSPGYGGSDYYGVPTEIRMKHVLNIVYLLRIASGKVTLGLWRDLQEQGQRSLS